MVTTGTPVKTALILLHFTVLPISSRSFQPPPRRLPMMTPILFDNENDQAFGGGGGGGGVPSLSLSPTPLG